MTMEPIGVFYRIPMSMAAIGLLVTLLLILTSLLCTLNMQRLLPLRDRYFALEIVGIWMGLVIFS
jgi:hypothetical protein